MQASGHIWQGTNWDTVFGEQNSQCEELYGNGTCTQYMLQTQTTPKNCSCVWNSKTLSNMQVVPRIGWTINGGVSVMHNGTLLENDTNCNGRRKI